MPTEQGSALPVTKQQAHEQRGDSKDPKSMDTILYYYMHVRAWTSGLE